jgi:hypothetical protein
VVSTFIRQVVRGVLHGPWTLTPAPAPIDWPARFRRAAEVADGEGWDTAAHVFGALSVKAKHRPDTVAAIERALLGEPD